jgi:hypothetical protein
VVVGKFTFLSSKLLPTKEEGGGKYQPTQGSEVTRQQGNEATKQKMGGVEGI